MLFRSNVSILIPDMSGGGAERVASILLHELSPKFNVHLAVLNHIKGYPIPKNVQEYQFSPTIRIAFLASIDLTFWYYRFCKKKKIDYSISLLNLANYPNASLKCFPFYWKGKVIVCERNYSSIKFGGPSKEDQDQLNKIKLLYSKADLVVANAKRMSIDLQTTFGISPQKTTTIYNPINLQEILDKKEEISPQTSTSTRSFTFVHVGSFKAQKNHQLLIDAFAKTLKKHKAQLWLVGLGGDQETVIKSYVQQLNLSHSIFFFGRQSNPFAFMARADCMVLSSDFEGLPNVLLEGLACSLPIISTDCLSGPREILAPNTNYMFKLSNELEIGEYGILVPTKNVKVLTEAMIRIIEDTNLLQAFRKKAVERAKHFDIQNIIPEFIKAIDSLTPS